MTHLRTYRAFYFISLRDGGTFDDVFKGDMDALQNASLAFSVFGKYCYRRKMLQAIYIAVLAGMAVPHQAQGDNDSAVSNYASRVGGVVVCVCVWGGVMDLMTRSLASVCRLVPLILAMLPCNLASYFAALLPTVQACCYGSLILQLVIVLWNPFNICLSSILQACCCGSLILQRTLFVSITRTRTR